MAPLEARILPIDQVDNNAQQALATPLRAVDSVRNLAEDLFPPQTESKPKVEKVMIPSGPITVFLRSDYEREELLKKGIELNKASDPHNMDNILEELRRKHA